MRARTARSTGIALQAMVLGIFLFLALIRLIAMASGARVFQYQGF